MSILVVVVLALLGCPGCSATEGRLDNPLRSFTIFQTGGWQVEIVADGSGAVGYGSSAGDVVQLPPETFDFVKTKDAMIATSHVDIPDGAPVFTVLLRMDDRTQKTIYTQEKELFVSFIQRGLDASGSRRLRDIWERHPIE
jgi:hypothetical protein